MVIRALSSMRLVSTLAGAAVLLAGCADLRATLNHYGMARPAPSGWGQVAVFDGHELWVRYDCAGAPLDVRYLGAFADARTSDGAVHRLARQPGGAHRHGGWGNDGGWTSYSGADMTLAGGAMSPTLTLADGQPRACRGVAA